MNQDAAPLNRFELKCAVCGAAFFVIKSKIGKRKTCSVKCGYEIQRRKDGHICVANDEGYIQIYKPQHVLANKYGTILLHRYLMWEAGKLKNLSDIVHHKDGNKKNNKLDNLEVMTQRAHASLHCPTQFKYVKK